MKNELTPIQPFLVLQAQGLKRLFIKNNGISHFYEFKVEQGQSGQFQAVPDGSTDLIFSIGNTDVRIFIGGTVFQVKRWLFEKERIHFGVCFHPGKHMLPDGLTIHEVVDADLELDPLEYGFLAEQIAQARDISQRAKIFLDYYTSKMQSQGSFDTTRTIEQYVRGRIYESQGNIAIQELAAETGYSECYIRRSFQHIHGLSPKVFERFVRFQSMLWMIETRTEYDSMEEITLGCGYYDQSHMIKDFKAFAGVTPEVYRRLVLEHPLKQGQVMIDEY